MRIAIKAALHHHTEFEQCKLGDKTMKAITHKICCALPMQFSQLTVSAATRFKPTPPARVDIKKTNALFCFSEVLTVKLLIAAKRSSALTDPSSRSYVYFRNSKKS